MAYKFLCVTTLALAALPDLLSADNAGTCDTHILARPADCPPLESMAFLPQRMRESNVFFPGGGVILDATARHQLKLLSQALRSPVMDGTCLRLVGHADPSGPGDINMQLSRLRAQTVSDFITSEMGPDTPPIAVAAKGETELLDLVPKNSIANRRVAIEARPCPRSAI